jgi:uncharacterized protein YggU (UPF0235/DUF167 family)
MKLPKKQISVVRGLTSRQKTIEIKTEQECEAVSQLLLPT